MRSPRVVVAVPRLLDLDRGRKVGEGAQGSVAAHRAHHHLAVVAYHTPWKRLLPQASSPSSRDCRA
jgi:hypothetical protein